MRAHQSSQFTRRDHKQQQHDHHNYSFSASCGFINPNIIVTTVLLFRDVGEERDMVVGMLSRCLLFEGQMWAYPVTVTEK